MRHQPRVLAVIGFCLAVLALIGGGLHPVGAQTGVPRTPSATPAAALVAWTSPVDRAANVDRRAPLTIRFNAEVDHAAVERGLSFTPAITGTFTWRGLAMTFEPAGGWEPGRFYYAVLRIDDRVIRRWSFTIRSVIRQIDLPQIYASWAEPLSITFDLSLDRASVEAALSITPAMRGTFSWTNTTLIFTPQTDWRPGTEYTVRLEPTIKTAGGKSLLRSAQSWHFSTPDESGRVTFGDGVPIQSLDPAGSRGLQFAVEGNLLRPVTVRIYALAPDQAVAQLPVWLKSAETYGGQPTVDLTGLPVVRQWQQAITARWQAITLTWPADLAPGMYIVTLDQPAADRTALLVSYTSQTLVLKYSDHQLTARLARRDGRAVPDAQLRVYDATGGLLAEGRADAQGLFATPLPADRAPAVVVGALGGELAISGLSEAWSQQLRTWWTRPAAPPPPVLNTRVVVYTDRPIYQPGQTVHAQIMARYDNDAIYSRIPLEWDINVRLRDARRNLIENRTLHVDEFGTLAVSFDLAEGGTLGEYAIEVQIKDEVHTQTFQVEDYRKPDFAVSVRPDRARAVNNVPLSVTVESRTFFDAPLVGASVTLRLYVRQSQWWYGEDAPRTDWVPLEAYTVKGRTDAQGRWQGVITPHLSVDLFDGASSAVVLIEATAVDDGGQSISSSAPLDVYDAPAQLSFTWLPRLYRVDQPIEFEALARDIFDQPLGHVPLTATIVSEYRNTQRPVAQTVARLDAAGRATFKIKAPQAGWYRVKIESAQSQPREEWILIDDGSGRWAAGAEEAQTLTVSADKTEYVSGDTALLTVRSAVSGPAWLTVERGRVRRTQVIDLTAPLTTVPVRLQDDDAPNVHITINTYQPVTAPDGRDWLSRVEARLLVASAEVRVSAAERRLAVSLAADRSSYAPRQPATLTVHVTDAAGQPVRAALSLAVVDEAVLSLSGAQAADVFTAFYGPRADSVQTYDSLRPQRYLPCECGGGGGGGENLVGNPRFNFPDTVFWNGSLRTDADGYVTVTLALPDALTRWQVVARAITADEFPRVGEAQLSVTTTQNLVIRPSVPRTLVQGDRVWLAASVHNNTTLTRTALVSVTAAGLPLIAAPQTITLPAQSAVTVGWWAEAATPGPITVTFSAKTDRAADAVRVVLPIAPLAAPEVESIVGEVTDVIEQSVVLPDAALPAASTLQIDVSPSIAAAMLDGLTYLTGYPHGCVEQTMSKALPNAVVGRALKVLGVSQPELSAQLPGQISAGLQRLYGYQHDDGGWGWWYDDATDDYQTAYVLFGLALTRQAGYTVDDGVIDRGAAYLKARLPQFTDARLSAYALLALAISGHGEAAATRQFSDTSDLDAFSRAALALAAAEVGDDAVARRWLTAVIDGATVDQAGAYWPTPVEDGEYQRKTLASTTRSTALSLAALVRLAPDHPLVPKAVRWLMAHRSADGWGTTQETAYTIVALTDYLRTAHELTAESTYRVYVNGRLWQQGTVSMRDGQQSLRVAGTQLRAGINRVRIERDGPAARVYFKITSQLMIGGVTGRATGPISVTRAYLDPRTHRPITQAQVGDVIEVQLKVTLPADGWYAALEDPLPGGLEALNERLSTTSFVARRNDYGDYDEFTYARNGYNQKEVRADRVVLYVTQLTHGGHTFTYRARVTRAGVFNALPARVFLMYEPEQWGRSDSRLLIVSPAD